MKRLLFITSLLMVLFVAFSPVFAETLVWTESVGADGYRVFIAPDPSSFDYSNPSADTTATSFPLPAELVAGNRYYFVCRAYNAFGESSNSNILGYTIPLEPVVIELPLAPTQITINFDDE